MRLGALLHQPVEEEDTGGTLKQKIRGPLAAVMATSSLIRFLRTYLYHIGVQCPRQNGSGKVWSNLEGHHWSNCSSIAGFDELSMALGEATAANNSDINEDGCFAASGSDRSSSVCSWGCSRCSQPASS